MAAASDSTITPFPLDRARKPDLLHRAIDEWNHGPPRRVMEMATSFRGLTDKQADANVRSILIEGGAEMVAAMLEETGRGIRAMRTIVDELAAIDALISSAAGRVLAESGL